MQPPSCSSLCHPASCTLPCHQTKYLCGSTCVSLTCASTSASTFCFLDPRLHHLLCHSPTTLSLGQTKKFNLKPFPCLRVRFRVQNTNPQTVTHVLCSSRERGSRRGHGKKNSTPHSAWLQSARVMCDRCHAIPSIWASLLHHLPR